MTIATLRNIGALIAVHFACANTDVVAGGAGDGTEVVGDIIDRVANGSPQTGVLAVPFSASLADGETLSIAYTVESSAENDLSGASTLVSATPSLVATGPTGGGTVNGVFKIDLPLGGAGRYVRAKFTPSLSAANTDTVSLSAHLIAAGMDRVPA